VNAITLLMTMLLLCSINPSQEVEQMAAIFDLLDFESKGIIHEDELVSI